MRVRQRLAEYGYGLLVKAARWLILDFYDAVSDPKTNQPRRTTMDANEKPGERIRGRVYSATLVQKRWTDVLVCTDKTTPAYAIHTMYDELVKPTLDGKPSSHVEIAKAWIECVVGDKVMSVEMTTDTERYNAVVEAHFTTMPGLEH